MSAQRGSICKIAFATTLSVSVLLLLAALVIVTVVGPPVSTPHIHGAGRAQTASRHNVREIHPIPFPRMITDWAVSIGSRLGA
jgi:hypothetical protein